MDTTQKHHLSHISLCFGYGGIDLGLHNIFGGRLRLAAVCEIEAFAVENALSKMEAGLLPAAPIWTDLRTFPWEEFQDVSLVSGGFPCQPFSAAGKRKGDQDPRHLFPFIVDGIKRCRPRFVFLENVEGIISSKLVGESWADPAGTPVLLHVLRELERVGYKATAGIFSASEVGAPHQRKRVFILAYDKSQRIQGQWADWLQESRPHAGQGLPLRGGDAGTNATAWPSRPGQPQYAWEPPRVVGNATSKRSCGGSEDGTNQQPEMLETGHEAVGNCDSLNRSASPERRQHDPEAGHTSEVLGNANSPRPQERTGQRGAGIQGTHADGGEAAERQTQPSLGRNLNGASGGLGYAELCVSCDNRTDELRLLGNGVVPATATRAFLTLLEKLNG